MESSYCQLKGVSGTGKGTRVAQLLLFLCDKYEYETFNTKVDSEVEQCVAIEFKTPRIAIIGKVLKSPSGLLNLEGIDHKHEVKELLYDKYRFWNLICEGFVLTGGKFFKPEYLKNNYGFNKQLWESYYYDTVEQLQERIVGRSGKRSAGKAFSGNKGIINEFNNVIQTQCAQHGFKCGIYKYDDPVTAFGIRYLNFIDRNDLIPDFISFSQTKSALRHITKPQDGDFFPSKLHNYCGLDGSVAGGQKILSTEEYEKALKTYNEKEPIYNVSKTLEKVEEYMKDINTIEEYNQRKDLPKYDSLKDELANLIRMTEYREIVKPYLNTINKFNELTDEIQDIEDKTKGQCCEH